jgi:hypothetical protein
MNLRKLTPFVAIVICLAAITVVVVKIKGQEQGSGADRVVSSPASAHTKSSWQVAQW